MDIAKIRKKIKEEKEGREEQEKARGEATRNSGEAPEAAPAPGEAEIGRSEELVAKESPATHEQRDEKEEAPSHETISPPAAKGGIPETAPAAKAAETEDISEEIVELLTFHLSTEEFAFRVYDIEEILRFQRIMPVPKVPDYILGITSLRGKIIPVIDLKKRLSINPSNPGVMT
ncbi:MAG: hypothetical protein EPN94_06560, partial [Nitrospirae bacterium]